MTGAGFSGGGVGGSGHCGGHGRGRGGCVCGGAAGVGSGGVVMLGSVRCMLCCVFYSGHRGWNAAVARLRTTIKDLEAGLQPLTKEAGKGQVVFSSGCEVCRSMPAACRTIRIGALLLLSTAM